MEGVSEVLRAYHSRRTSLGPHRISIDTHEWVVGNCIESVWDVAWHAKKKRKDHSKPKSSIENGRNTNTKGNHDWCILDLLRFRNISTCSKYQF